jgi:hypothetical protein
MLTLLLGWAGSTPRRLAPFVDIHRDLGNDTRIFVADAFGSLIRLEKARAKWAVEAHRIVAAAESGPMCVHLFSENGFIVFCMMVDVWRRTDEGRDLMGRIRGIILDSAPGLYAANRAEFTRRFAYAATPFILRILRQPAQQHHPILTPALERCLDLYQVGWADTVRKILGVFDAVAADYPACPHLFVYSARDLVVPAADIEAFAAIIRNRGAPAQTLRFDTDAHIGGIQFAPNEYRRAIIDFCKESLEATPKCGSTASDSIPL